MALLESAGCPVTVQRGRRVFPSTEKASDVTRALTSLMRSAGVSVRLNTAVRSLETEDGRITAVRTVSGERIPAGAVILCTGGISYPATGSTGDGYRLAAELGHTVLPPSPVLVGLETAEDWPRSLQGLSLRNVTLTLSRGKKTLYEELGEMLFTHFGVSGPLVLSASAHMRRMGEAEYRLSIDLKPGLDEKKLDARILRDFEKYANRAFRNALGDLLGHSMIPVVVRLSQIDPEKPVHDITREERLRLLHLLKAFPVAVSQKRPIDEAIVTAGGVSTREINPRTMESKLLTGLYFAGEVLDVDAYTGGFNL
jgi:predicted Rossmann fold flavoprotein